jgi:hypothetical protein
VFPVRERFSSEMESFSGENGELFQLERSVFGKGQILWRKMRAFPAKSERERVRQERERESGEISIFFLLL